MENNAHGNNSGTEALPPIENIIPQQSSYMDSPFFITSTVLFLLGVIVFFLMAHLIKHDKEPTEILKAFGIPLIIIASVIVVLTGFSTAELSPIIGLLGTIAGYLLGRGEQELRTRSTNEGNAQNDPLPPG